MHQRQNQNIDGRSRQRRQSTEHRLDRDRSDLGVLEGRVEDRPDKERREEDVEEQVVDEQ